MHIGNTSLCETEDTYPPTQPYVARLADLYPLFCKRDAFSICIVYALPGGARGIRGTSSVPLDPSGLPLPPRGWACGPRPGAGSGKYVRCQGQRRGAAAATLTARGFG